MGEKIISIFKLDICGLFDHTCYIKTCFNDIYTGLRWICIMMDAADVLIFLYHWQNLQRTFLTYAHRTWYYTMYCYFLEMILILLQKLTLGEWNDAYFAKWAQSSNNGVCELYSCRFSEMIFAGALKQVNVASGSRSNGNNKSWGCFEYFNIQFSRYE